MPIGKPLLKTTRTPKTNVAPNPHRIESDASVRQTFIAQVKGLQVGESTAKVQLVDPYLPSYLVVEGLSDWKQRLLGSITTAVKRVRQETGWEFRTDCGDLIMPKGGWFIVVTVTRTN